MKETVLARTALAPPLALVAIVYGIFVVALAGIPGVLGWVFVAGATWAAMSFVRRIISMRLAVNDQSVIVVNFRSQHALELDTVLVDSRVDREAWPQDDLMPGYRRSLAQGEPDVARGLWLSDATGTEVRVGVAPAYGSRLDALAEELIMAIEERRSAAA